jgi:1-acyl-sn-glycerol-3-phosphate acyltransferase
MYSSMRLLRTRARVVAAAVSTRGAASVGLVVRASSLQRRVTAGLGGYAARAIALPYAALAMIPASFGIVGGIFHLQGDRERTRGCLLMSVAGVLCLPLSAVMLLSYPAVLLLDNDRRYFYDRIMRAWARGAWYPLLPAPIIDDRLGEVPTQSARIVYMVNHQSWLDIFALSHLDHPFRFVSKKEISHIPVCGWVLESMLRHVVFDRKSKDGGRAAIDLSSKYARNGNPVLWFPEVSRARAHASSLCARGRSGTPPLASPPPRSPPSSTPHPAPHFRGAARTANPCSTLRRAASNRRRMRGRTSSRLR